MLASSPFIKIPQSRSARWALLKSAIADWYAPLGRSDGFSKKEIAKAEKRLGFKLPKALKEWYELAGAREDIWNQHDEMSSPEELYCQIYDDSAPYDGLFENVLVFYTEHLGSYYWGIPRDRANEEDPPVVIDDRGDWRILSPTVSEFALSMFVYCLKWEEKRPFWCCGDANSELIAQIDANIPNINFPSWRYERTQVYGYKEVIVEAIWESGKADDIYTFITATTETAFEEVTQYLSSQNFDCHAASWEM